jgi:hypothetical protein
MLDTLKQLLKPGGYLFYHTPSPLSPLLRGPRQQGRPLQKWSNPYGPRPFL